MHLKKNVVLRIAAVVILATTGCEQGDHERLAEMAEKHSERQAEQNRQMSQLNREVATGTRALVEADSKSQEHFAALQREVQTERTEFGRQRDLLEEERRRLAAQRRWDPVVAQAITSVGLLLACLLPLVLCWYLLHHRADSADDHAVVEVLLMEFSSGDRIWPLAGNDPAAGLIEDDETPSLLGNSEDDGDKNANDCG